jgi:hypothetical protein
MLKDLGFTVPIFQRRKIYFLKLQFHPPLNFSYKIKVTGLSLLNVAQGFRTGDARENAFSGVLQKLQKRSRRFHFKVFCLSIL